MQRFYGKFLSTISYRELSTKAQFKITLILNKYFLNMLALEIVFFMRLCCLRLLCPRAFIQKSFYTGSSYINNIFYKYISYVCQYITYAYLQTKQNFFLFQAQTRVHDARCHVVETTNTTTSLWVVSARLWCLTSKTSRIRKKSATRAIKTETQ